MSENCFTQDQVDDISECFEKEIDKLQSENANLKEMLERMADLFLPMESDYNDNHNKTQQGMNLLAEYREWKQKQI